MHFSMSALFQGLALCVIAGCAPAASTDSAVSRFELPNGLQVILRPVSGAPHVAVVTLFSIGGDHDPAGESGLAHFMEHVYTTAAAGSVPVRSAEEFMRAYPAGWNAQTGDDYTVFATVVDPSALDAEIKHHSQRMGDLRITDDDLRRELPRIEQELTNMFGKIPALGALNHARERVRPTPHDGRKGGRIDQLKLVTLQQLQSRWQQFYKPRNALLVVAGHFDAAHVRAAIEAEFGPLPSGEAALPAGAAGDAARIAAESIEVTPRHPSMPSSAALAFAVPAPSSDDYPALLVLVHRLMMNSSAMGVGQPSSEPSLRFAFLDDPNVLQIVADLKPEESLEQVEARLRAFVEKVTSAAWNRHEPALAKQNLAFFLGTSPLPDAALTDNAYGAAFSLGRRQQLGLDGAALAKKLDRVTAADLKRVTNGYFSAEKGAVIAVRTRLP